MYLVAQALGARILAIARIRLVSGDLMCGAGRDRRGTGRTTSRRDAFLDRAARVRIGNTHSARIAVIAGNQCRQMGTPD